ncbi:MAG: molecular chaperone HtpG [Bacteroidetes bacterium]|nr:molecular chaperone HtpG [Bacteroidota bacterium]
MTQTSTKKGNISVNTENIFPLIKKSLYSNQEIFLRELVSNGVDACQKLAALAAMGEVQGEIGEMQVQVRLDKEAKTITISDNGLGLSEEEIEKYITQVAFSGATEFIEKYKDKSDLNQIIGAFGLGFYSAFMVADRVDIHTLSYQQGSNSARWSCDGSTEYEIGLGERSERGTDIVLHVAEDASEYLDEWRLKEILRKYGKFLPVKVMFGEEHINATSPLWTRKPADLQDEDYQNFYNDLYPMAEKPLFWIHLNVDYPFNLTGILYFPKLKADFEPAKNKIQLFSRQVFITDSVEEVVPDYLRLLHGVIDSPDIPLNVSRSFLQTDSNVKKINAHISKKVADKLADIAKNQEDSFREKWDQLELFVKYGMISDEKFYDRAKGFCLYKDADQKLSTWEDTAALLEANHRNKDGQLVVLYTNQASAQHHLIEGARKRGLTVLQMGSVIDAHFIGALESKLDKTTFKRIDSDTLDKLVDKGESKTSLLNEEQEKLAVEWVSEWVKAKEEFKVKAEAMSADDPPITLTRSEFMRRMNEMAATGGGSPFFGGPMKETIDMVVNTSHPLVQKLVETQETEPRQALGQQLIDLALLSQGMLQGAELTAFIDRNLHNAGR